MLNPTQPFFYLLAYLAILYVRPHEYMPALKGVPVLPGLLLSAFFFWLLRQKKRMDAPQFTMLPLQTAVMFLSVVLTGWMGGAITVLVDFLPVVMLFFMLATSLDSRIKFSAVFALLTSASVVMALHGADQMNTGIGWTGAATIDGRITYLGFLNDPNDLSMSMLMTMPMGLYLAQRSGFVMRWVWRAAIGVILYGVWLTNSRGAILGLGSMLFVYGILRYGVWRSVFVLPVLAVPLLLLAPSRISEISADEESAAGRVDAWYEGFQMLRAHPLFGVGKGMFTEHHWLTAHSSYMLTLSELGLVGYTIWLSIIMLSVMMLLRLVRSSPPEAAMAPTADAAVPWSEVQTLGRTLLYSTTAVLVCAAFLSRSYTVILYVHIALVVAAFQLGRTHHAWLEPVRWRGNAGRLIGISLATVFVLWLLTRFLL